MKVDNRFVLIMPLVFLAVAGMVLINAITPYGMGLVNDSVGYIAGARNILAGNGYSRLTGNASPIPITNYPPLFSILISGLMLTGMDALLSAKVLNIVLFGCNIILVGLMAKRLTQSTVFSLLAALFFTISSPIFVAHTYAMTEPLYIFLSLLALIVFLNYLGTLRYSLLVFAGLLTGGTILTRYVGVSVFFTIVLVVALLPEISKNGMQTFLNRLKALVIYAVSSLALPIIWLLRNFLVSDNPANRQLVYHPIPAYKINEGLENFWGWLLPERGNLVGRFLPFLGILLIVGLIFLFALTVTCFIRLNKTNSGIERGIDRAIFVNLAYSLLYLAVLLLSLLFADASPIFEHRILAPFYIQLLILSVWWLTWFTSNKLLGKGIAGLAALFLVISFAGDSLDIVKQLRQEGQGFASSEWRESELINEVKNLPKMTVYTNKATALYLLADRPSYVLPSPINPATNAPRENYAQDVEEIRQNVMKGKAVMVIFDYALLLDSQDDRQWMLDLTEGVPIYREAEDGNIFGSKN